VEKESLAARGGLQEGDILVAFGGVAVTGVDDLHRILGEEQINKAVDVAIIRAGHRRTIAITPIESQRN
jgi:S1-C subfamily serine protease